jgi:hypothetical protein
MDTGIHSGGKMLAKIAYGFGRNDAKCMFFNKIYMNRHEI